MKSDELTGMYYDYAMAAPVIAGIGTDGRSNTDGGERADMLILGMGTGTYARQCRKYFDDINVTGVEIDGKITELSYKYFDALPDVPVYTYDGRAYLQTIDKEYDVIMVDAYQDISIPFQMSSREFFTEVYDHLKDNGVMVVNMNMRSDTAGEYQRIPVGYHSFGFPDGGYGGCGVQQQQGALCGEKGRYPCKI